jgi:nucleotide-binding universal stress UspA family protein
MYTRILVPVENSPYDVAILDHVRGLAKLTGASVVLIHVADGWAARNANQLELRESEEMRKDRQYLDRLRADLERDNIDADSVLAGGEPSKEIAEAADREKCDLIAMSTHGHRFVKDLLFGSVANEVRHITRVPVLLVRGGTETERDTTEHHGAPEKTDGSA